jgi:MOSC domain-containing protein YiiM
MHQIDMEVSATLTKNWQKLLHDQEDHKDHGGPVSTVCSWVAVQYIHWKPACHQDPESGQPDSTLTS